jgi:Tol biopolymer transport system component
MKLRLVLAVVWAGLMAADSAAVMLEAAARKERVNGDLKGAIAEYRKIAARFGKDAEVAAEALWRMGQCQEKLGEAEARRSYERVVKEYGGAARYAAQARARLAAMGGGTVAATPQARVVWDQATDYWGRVSADGRYLSFVDWETGDLAIRDLVNGESRRVTNSGGYEKAMGEAESTSLAPDGKRIVFNWHRWDPAAKQEGSFELRIINSDGSGGRTLWKASNDRYFEAYGWSADSRWVALSEGSGGAGRIVLLSPDSGETREVATKGKHWKSSIAFSPDGKWLAYEEPMSRQARVRNVYVVAADGAGAGETMVAEGGATMGWTPRGDGLVFRRTEGNAERLYLVPVTGGKAAGRSTLLDVPMASGFPGPLGITPAGQLFYGTSNRSSEALLARIDLEKGFAGEPLRRMPVSGIGFGVNHGNLRFSPDGKLLASSVSVKSIRIQPVAGGEERILTVPLQEMSRFEWMPDGSAIVASAPVKDGKVGLYRIDTQTGAATYLCELARGVVFAMSADGKAVYEVEMKGLVETELATGNKRVVVARDFSGQGPASIRRSHDGKYLAVATFRFLGVFDIARGEMREVYRRDGESGPQLNGVNWTADGRTLIAKFSGSNGKVRYLQLFPLDGGAKRTIPLDFGNSDFATSPDGVHWAIVATRSRMQVWAIENFLPSR